jgi:hypothetical protein
VSDIGTRYGYKYWSGREDSNLRPLGPKSQVRQKANFCHFTSCSHHEFIRVLRVFPIRHHAYRRCAENSIHKLATRFWGEPRRHCRPLSLRNTLWPLAYPICYAERTMLSRAPVKRRRYGVHLDRTVRGALIVNTNANACAPVSARLLILRPIKLE